MLILGHLHRGSMTFCASNGELVEFMGSGLAITHLSGQMKQDQRQD